MRFLRGGLLGAMLLIGACKGGEEACVPQCTGRSCGDDGCGGDCGTCPVGDVCATSGTCVACDSGPGPAILPAVSGANPADDYLDPVTGHRVVRLSRLPGGASNFYFHQNAFNCRGDRMLFANAHGTVGRWLYAIDLETYEIEPIALSEGALFELVGRKRNEVYYGTADWRLLATNLDTKATRTVAQLPANTYGFTINVTEQLLLGYTNEGISDFQHDHPDDWQYQYADAKRPTRILTVDADTGATTVVHEENLWLDHAQFSPTDPDLYHYYHEGPRHDPDRVWLAHRTNDFAPRSLRSIIQGNHITHEFWSPDGTRVFYDHHRWDLPEPPTYFLSTTDVVSGTHVDVPLQDDDWSLHYNISRDGTLIAGDGDATRRQILLYRIDAGTGIVTVEPLADITGNDTEAIQPNVQFTPDGKWVVFRSEHQGGESQVYAVSVE